LDLIADLFLELVPASSGRISGFLVIFTELHLDLPLDLAGCSFVFI
jgi:hypothetical protein